MITKRRNMRITKLLILTMTVSITTVFAQESSVNGNSQVAKGSPLVSPQIQVIPIQDSKTERNYELYIELPEDYSENNNKTYPVLYYTDAVWHREVLSAGQEFILEDVILVGISWQKDINEDLKNEVGAHVSRFRDYSISEHSNPEIQEKYQLGQADNHLDFIRNDIIKYVDNTYRTDPDSRTYFGYSLSGEFGAYILLTQPDTFDNYIIGSPSIKNEVEYLSELYANIRVAESYKGFNANVFVAYGSLEEEEVVEPIKEFIDIIDRNIGISLQSEVIEGNHGTAFPMTAIRSMNWLSNLIGTITSSEAEILLNNSSPIGFIKIPQLNKAFMSTKPEDRNDGIEVGEMGVDGGNKDMILGLAEEIANGKYGRYDSFLIAHKDKLIFESYYARGRINLPHGQASATKSYTSMAVGRAIQLGYLTMADLDKPLIHFLKELDTTKLVEGAELITLHKAMTMRSGIRIDREQQEKFQKNPDEFQGQRHVQALLEHSATITTDSQSFLYQDDPALVMQVLEAVVPGTAKDFIKNELLDKMGIIDYGWQTEFNGLPTAGWGSSMTSRDMAKFGILTINKGKWNGERLIPEAFITKATNRILLTGDDDIYGGGKDVSNQGYGYYWWSGDLKYGDKTYFSNSAQGGGGQYIILIEELDLMIVVTAADNDNTTLQIIAEQVLPAFVK